MKIKRILKWIAIAVPVVLLGWFAFAWFSSSNACDTLAGAAPVDPIKAIVYCEYGLADVLTLEQIEKPVPEDDQMLVKVHAAAANPLDWHYMRGTPYLMRMMTGLRKPKDIRLGVDYAGTVEAVGRNVTQFKPGDEVFGGRAGAFAEYVVARAAGSVVLKPSDITFEQAAALPIAAVTALQGLRQGEVGPGTKVLINGASGGVGTFAVQIAHSLGAEVTGVSSTRNLEMVRSLGADKMIDYTQADYTQSGERYDVILDNVGNRSLLENRRALTEDGKFVLIGGGGPDNGLWIGPMMSPVKAMFLSPFIKQEMGLMFAELTKDDLTLLAGLVQSGDVTSVIDRRYKLSEVPEAIRYLETGRARGKVIITIE
jgi:NADPH:quinone reductase-like Zn-dependent oxidoreductase